MKRAISSAAPGFLQPHQILLFSPVAIHTLDTQKALRGRCVSRIGYDTRLQLRFTDKIRTRARHTAWKATKASGWHPWIRKISHTSESLYDEENPRASHDTHHSRAHSEACVAGEIELNRMPDDQTGSKHTVTTAPPSRRSTEPIETIADRPGEASDGLTRRKTHKTDSDEEQPENSYRRSSIERTRKQAIITPWTQFRDVMFGSWFNILFLFVPAGFAVYYTQANPIAVFCVNFIALIPSIMTLDYAMEEVGSHVGGSIQALLSITFG